MSRLHRDIIDNRVYRYSPDITKEQVCQALGILTNLASSLKLIRPTESQIELGAYNLKDSGYSIDASASLACGSVSGEIQFIPPSNSEIIEFTRPFGDVLWSRVETKINYGAANIPNEQIIQQIRHLSPSTPIDPWYLGPQSDESLFRFLSGGLARSRTQRRDYRQIWDRSLMHGELGTIDPRLVLATTAQRFISSTRNGSQSYTYALQAPGLPMEDGTLLVKRFELSAHDIHQKRCKVGASVIHAAMANPLGEVNLNAAIHASAGSKITADDLVSRIDESARDFVRCMFTVDNLV